jgi:hypothetical protein
LSSLFESSFISLGFLGLNSSKSSSVSSGFSSSSELSLLSSEWVESVSDGSVGEWVLLGLVVSSNVGSGFSELGLNLIGVNDSGEVSACHD